MKTFLSLIILALIGVTAWYFITQHKTTEVVTVTTTNTDTLLIVKDSIINANSFDTIPLGFYQGMLPCKNCEGVQRTVMFNADDEYTMEEVNWGRGTNAIKTQGTWTNEKGLFVLSQKGKIVSKYKLVKDSLINTEYNGARIPDSLSAQYVLFKKNTSPQNVSWKQRKSEGIDIVGNGTEPFWSIEIDKEKLILFRLADTQKPVIIPIERPVMTKDSVVYSVTTDGGIPLKISISSRFCNDGMSDHLYEYKMTVWFKGKVYKGCAVMLNDDNKSYTKR
ncbi:copper resistance protein NlpE N-terminal domain-containing protein [Flavitalea sp.]|nr:copper resistance protein NlpE N-terminal domain-containing protein [Flavitalea sp.]